MKVREVVRTAVLTAVAATFIETGVARLPASPDKQPFEHEPAIVYGEPMLPPVTVMASPPPRGTPAALSNGIPRNLPRRIAHALIPTLSIHSDVSLFPRPARRRRFWPERGPFTRAPLGEPVDVSLTQYCLRGTTRRGRPVREGIVAADPRVFPLAHHVEIFVGKHFLGRFLVDDTGRNVKGPTLDIWNPNCREARRFGRQWGTARLIEKPE